MHSAAFWACISVLYKRWYSVGYTPDEASLWMMGLCMFGLVYIMYKLVDSMLVYTHRK